MTKEKKKKEKLVKGFAQQPFDLKGKHYEAGDTVECDEENYNELTDKNVKLMGKSKPAGETKEAKGGEVKG